MLKFEILGPVVQNLMKLLADMTWKFLPWNMADTLVFFAEKMWVAFAVYMYIDIFCWKMWVFAKKYQCIWNTLATTVNEFVINELVKLTMHWIAGPWLSDKQCSTGIFTLSIQAP